ncbi:MAG: hypothetical protein HZB59_13650 [Ignavibacteriales bacterium]|nr:hypothetical protein [Ignavibacteriales bacterium]
MRSIIFILLSLFLVSCREIESPADLGSINGYEVRGRVSTANGIPIDSVQVSLYYYYDYVGNKQLDTVEIIITDTMQVLDVTVFTNKFKEVRKIFSGRWGILGPVHHIYWNGRDDNNLPAPSGLYYMVFTLDSTVVKQNKMIIDGNVTTVTDYYGRFALPDETLPVGVLFDAYNDDGSFHGVLKIEPKIALVLNKRQSVATYESIYLTNNTITSLALTLE